MVRFGLCLAEETKQGSMLLGSRAPPSGDPNVVHSRWYSVCGIKYRVCTTWYSKTRDLAWTPKVCNMFGFRAAFVEAVGRCVTRV